MLKLDKIVKNYVTGDTVVNALKGVSVEFRKSEFVAILGASGCGKTTLLNIVGGLDKYTSGDLVINGNSTKNYTDYDWDTYRNHSVGFVFQSYNLIPHQTVLANVELALTLSGVSKAERRARAKEALKKVGLEGQINKKPNQLSGGQMQRVSIARAIVNDPEIILADEPTGALDSTTSIQVMDILAEIAKDRLVVMVTHNAKLADEYANRIINLSDGEIIGDSNPYDSSKEPEEKVKQEQEELTKREIKKRKKKSSMSFWTAFSLSLNNLMTKKARTILTAFAGSIGIIGIALILSLSSGFQGYIDKVQEDTLSTYPITIEEQTFSYADIMEGMQNNNSKPAEHDKDKIYSNNNLTEMLKKMMSGVRTNNLKDFKKYLDNYEDIDKYVSDIKYTYNSKLYIYKDEYSETENDRLVPTSLNALDALPDGMFPGINIQEMVEQMVVWEELLNNDELLNSQYDLIGEGSKWPTKYNEVVIVVNENNEITEHILYSLGLKGEDDFKELIKNMFNPDYKPAISSYSYEELLGLKYKLVAASDFYEYDGTLYNNISEDTKKMKNVLDNALEMQVVGIVRPKEKVQANSINGAIGYSKELTEYLINKNMNSDVVKAQIASKDKNVITGEAFPEETRTVSTNKSTVSKTYEQVLSDIGYADFEKPQTISIYPSSFEAKEKINDIISEYNEGKDVKDQIKYTNYIDMMMDSMSVMIDAISYVLIAFVSISLVVSSIMIGIITYISVLERTKEIGVLRSIGARKKDISRVFNAETILIGLVAGVLGIVITMVLDIPINIILNHLAGIQGVAKLPVLGSLILVLISVLLTAIAGLIPSRIAAKKDPVIALRTE